MGQKQDIGKLFEDKLNSGTKKPSKNLWEKINTSLDVEKRRKKRIVYYWLIAGGIVGLLGVFLIMSKENLFLKTSEQNNISPLKKQSTIYSETTLEEVVKAKPNLILTNDTLLVLDEDVEMLSKIIVANKESQLLDENTKQSNSQTHKNANPKSRRKTFDESYKVSKKYYYYNSKDGKQLVTTNKEEIDSLISERHKSNDSLSNLKTDHAQ